MPSYGSEKNTEANGAVNPVIMTRGDVADAISLEKSDWTLDFRKLLGSPRFGSVSEEWVNIV
jgi:hypothetical protein